jgi:hypothetical protein
MVSCMAIESLWRRSGSLELRCRRDLSAVRSELTHERGLSDYQTDGLRPGHLSEHLLE